MNQETERKEKSALEMILKSIGIMENDLESLEKIRKWKLVSNFSVRYGTIKIGEGFYDPIFDERIVLSASLKPKTEEYQIDAYLDQIRFKPDKKEFHNGHYHLTKGLIDGEFDIEKE